MNAPELGLAIIDLDGTLCDDGHRVHYANSGEYELYHRLCDLDSPHMVEAELVRAWSQRGGGIVYSTGRYSSKRQITEHWLSKHDLPFGLIFMRFTRDRRPAALIKNEVLLNLIAQGNKIAFAMDDDDDVVAMYRENGIVCLQPRSRRLG